MIDAFDVLNLSAVAAVALILGYTAFWAFRVRKALAIRVYRNQALGIALIALILALEPIADTAIAYLVYKNPFDVVGTSKPGLFFVFLVALFYWIDASILAARRSDPESRDFLHWRILRIPLWIGVLPTTLLVVPFDIYSLIAGILVSTPPPSGLAVILFPGIFIPPVAGLVLLPLLAQRTSDPLLRRHLKWFGVFAAIFLVFFFFSNLPDQTIDLFLTYVRSVVSSYCLYRSVLSLTPLETSNT